MQQAFTRSFECPGCPAQAWIHVSISGRCIDAEVRTFATHGEAMASLRDAMAGDAFEGFIRPVECPGPTGTLLVWFGNDPLEVNVWAFRTRSKAFLELARLLEADKTDPETAVDAAELRRLAVADSALAAATTAALAAHGTGSESRSSN